jgi:hypothetical protein
MRAPDAVSGFKVQIGLKHQDRLRRSTGTLRIGAHNGQRAGPLAVLRVAP